MLAHPPHAITILDVVTTLEGPFMPADATCLDSLNQPSEDRAVICEVWVQLRAAIEEVLGNMTLDDLCQRKRERTVQPMYYI